MINQTEDLITKLKGGMNLNQQDNNNLLKIVLDYKKLSTDSKQQYNKGFVEGTHAGRNSILDNLYKEQAPLSNTLLDECVSLILVANTEDKDVDIFSNIEEVLNTKQVDKADLINYILKDKNILKKFENIFKYQGHCIDLHKDNMMDMF